MKARLFTLLLAGSSLAALAQCPVTVTTSGTGLTRTYSASSAASGMSYTWYQAGFSATAGSSITRSYTYGGRYWPTVVGIKTSPSCLDSVSFVDTVSGPINCAGFTPTMVATGSGMSRTFNVYSNSTTGYTSLIPPNYSEGLSFSYGDGTTGNTAVHTYAASGTYSVTVTITYAAAGYPTCTKTATTSVTISTPPAFCNTANAAFTASGSGTTYTFTNASTPATMPSGVGVSYSLNFGDGNGSIAFNSGPTSTHTYTQNGTFNVILQAIYSQTVSPYNYLCTKYDTVQVTATGAPNTFDVWARWDSTTASNSQQVKFWLIQYNSSTQMLTAVDSAIGSGSGWAHASFNNKPDGSYRIKAHMLNQPANTAGYMPTYYDSSLNWNTATVINCTGCGYQSYTWFLKHGTTVAGNGFVGGSVLTGANKGTGAGDPVVGQLIFLRDASSKTVRAATTDASGQYSFANLPTGDYTVYPEELNYATTPSAVLSVTGFQNTKAGVNFRKNDNAHTIVPAAAAPAGVATTATGAVRVHPNPTTGFVTVQLPAAGSDVSVRVLSVTGQEVYAERVAAATAVKGWTLNLSELPAGIYNLSLTNAESSYTEKLVLQR